MQTDTTCSSGNQGNFSGQVGNVFHRPTGHLHVTKVSSTLCKLFIYLMKPRWNLNGLRNLKPEKDNATPTYPFDDVIYGHSHEQCGIQSLLTGAHIYIYEFAHTVVTGITGNIHSYIMAIKTYHAKSNYHQVIIKSIPVYVFTYVFTALLRLGINTKFRLFNFSLHSVRSFNEVKWSS